MAKPAFDTLGAARELEAKGFPPDQAGGIVNTIQRSKGDLVTSELFETRTAEMRANSDRRFAELRAHIDAGLAAQEAKLYRALWLQGGAIVGVLTGLVGLVAGLQTILSGG